MRRAKVHCKNCRYFLKNKNPKSKACNINPLMVDLVNSSKEIKYDGVCIKSGSGVYLETKCKLWKYNEKNKMIRYISNACLDNYECENQLNIYDIIKGDNTK